MKILSVILFLFLGTFVYAQTDNPYDYLNQQNSFNFPNSNLNSKPFEDNFGNNYKHYDNLFNDTDNDGLTNYFDNNDQDKDYFKSLYKSDNNSNSYQFNTPSTNYNSSYYDFNSNKTIYTGPQGGQYYINKNGNKTYIKK